MARPLRSRCAAAPRVAAAGSNDADSGDCCEESRPSLRPPLNANPGNCCEELPVLVPEINPIRIANAQTTTAAIHVIRTATRPAELASNVRFTMTLEISSVLPRRQCVASADLGLGDPGSAAEGRYLPLKAAPEQPPGIGLPSK